METIGRIAGHAPHTCPWMAFHDPLVVEVIQAYRMAVQGEGITPALLLQLDPPNVVWEGVLYYNDAIARIRLDDHRRLARER